TTADAGSTVELSFELEIENNDRYVPLQNITLELSGPENLTCTYELNGNFLAGDAKCSQIPFTQDTAVTGGIGYGYGYGYGSGMTEFGYGYGYGTLGSSASFTWSADWNTTGFKAGTYTIQFQATASGETTQTYSATEQTIALAAIITDETDIADIINAPTPQANITIQKDVTLKPTGSNSTIKLAQNTVIKRADGQNINASQLKAKTQATSTVQNVPGTPRAVLQWGIEGEELTFNPAITIQIDVGAEHNGETLDVRRSTNTNSGWTTDGLGSSTCVVSNGICEFTTTKASYFTAATPSTTTTTTTTTTTGGGGGAGLGPAAATTRFITLSPGQQAIWTPNKAELPVQRITLEVAQQQSNMRLDLQRVTSPAHTLPQTYRYLELTASERFKQATIEFSVPSSWLEQNNLAAEAIALHRHTGTEWQELPTTAQETRNGYVHYSATTTEFSLFAIAPRTPAQEAPEQEGIIEEEDVVVEDEIVEEEDVVVEDEIVEEETPSQNNLLWWIIGAALIIALAFVFFRKK
ncbi:MAG: PGF-pre-PGF domain-containing protein, partial [Candidatus Woesearchaeota archaeon]